MDFKIPGLKMRPMTIVEAHKNQEEINQLRNDIDCELVIEMIEEVKKDGIVNNREKISELKKELHGLEKDYKVRGDELFYKKVANTITKHPGAGEAVEWIKTLSPINYELLINDFTDLNIKEDKNIKKKSSASVGGENLTRKKQVKKT